MKSSIVLTAAAAMAVGNAAFASNHVLSSATPGGGASIAHAAIQNSPITAGAMTIEFWIRYEGGSSNGSTTGGRVVSKRGCSYEGYTLTLYGTGATATLRVGFGSGVVSMGWDAGSIPAHQWHHVAFTWDKTALVSRFVVDGIQVATRTMTASEVPGSATNPLQFMEQCGWGAIGAIDNIRIWSIARTVSQIAADRYREYTPSEAQAMPGLVGAWTFESGGIVDSTGQNPVGATYGVGAIATEEVPVPTQVSVPGDFPTIQSAIDGTPSGVNRTINVAPGSYTGPIDFRGKNVVVRGAGAGSTIIAGNGGLTTSVVRMSGEPATAALESVTVRGGTTGTPLPNLPTALVGGGVFADTSAASIRNCTIENNSAGFGGGVYMLNCSGSVSGCIIRNNTASTDGGGIQANQSTVRLTDDMLQGNTANSRGGGMHLVQGTPVLMGVSVTGNQSNNTMGGISWYSVGATGTMLDLSACTVNGNNAGTGQGGIGATDGGLITMRFAGTNACSNLPRPNVVGQWQDLGGNTICDCVGDITVDGRVDGADLGSMLSAWGTCTAACPADLNRDGKVDGFDLGLLLASWGPCGG